MIYSKLISSVNSLMFLYYTCMRKLFSAQFGTMLMKGNYMIVEAIAEHAQAVCNVIKQSVSELCIADHNNDPDILQLWLSNKTPENCRVWIENKNSKSFVAIKNNIPVGISQMGINGYIYLCYLHPDETGKGTGKKLLAACEKQALSWGLKNMIVDSSYTAKQFYVSQGFEFHKEPYIENNLRSYPMIKVLTS